MIPDPVIKNGNFFSNNQQRMVQISKFLTVSYNHANADPSCPNFPQLPRPIGPRGIPSAPLRSPKPTCGTANSENLCLLLLPLPVFVPRTVAEGSHCSRL